MANAITSTTDLVGLQSVQNSISVSVERLADIEEFNDIQSPLATFVFCDERLRFVEARGDLSLRHTSLATGFYKSLDKRFITGSTKGAWH